MNSIKEEPMPVVDYVKTLKPIDNLSAVAKGQKIFNKYSIDVSFVDTFISYSPYEDIVEYENSKGEIWRGAGKGYWFFID